MVIGEDWRRIPRRARSGGDQKQDRRDAQSSTVGTSNLSRARTARNAGSGRTAFRPHSQFDPVELLFEAVEGVVADLVPIAHLEDGLPGRGQGALVDLFEQLN